MINEFIKLVLLDISAVFVGLIGLVIYFVLWFSAVNSLERFCKWIWKKFKARKMNYVAPNSMQHMD